MALSRPGFPFVIAGRFRCSFLADLVNHFVNILQLSFFLPLLFSLNIGILIIYLIIITLILIIHYYLEHLI